MTTIARLMVALGLDSEKYKEGLDEAEKAADAKARSIGDKLGGIGDAMTNLGGKMTLGVTLPIVGGMTASVLAASDLQETMSKTNVVFGDASKGVIQFGDTAAEKLGVSKQQALEAASTFGNLFVSMKMGQKQSADMSTNLIQLASDLASFNNMDPTEVLEKLRAGLTGETEPLKSLGVNINQLTLEAKGLELGLAPLVVNSNKLEQATSAVNKAQDALNKAMKAGGEGSIAAKKAALDLASAHEKLESAENNVAKAADAVQKARFAAIAAGEKYGANSRQYSTAIESVHQAEMNLQNARNAVSIATNNMKKEEIDLQAAMAAGGPGSEAVAKATAELERAKSKLAIVQQGEPGNLDAAGKAQAAYALILEQTKTAQGDFGRTSDGLANQMRIGKAEFMDVAAKLGENLLPMATKLVSWANDMVAGFKTMSPETQRWILVIGGIAAAIGPVLMVVGSLVSTIGTLLPVIAAVGAVLSGPVGLAIAIAVAAVVALKLAWDNNLLGIRDIVYGFLNWLQPIFDGTWKNLKSLFAAFSAAFNGDWYTFGQKIREIWDTNWKAFQDVVKGFYKWFGEMDWLELGKSIVMGIIHGIMGQTKQLGETMKSLAEAAALAFKGFMGIKSPSSVFAGYGRQMMAGLALGIQDSSLMPQVSLQAAVSGLTTTPAGNGVQAEISGLRDVFASQPRPASAAEIATALRDALMMVMG